MLMSFYMHDVKNPYPIYLNMSGFTAYLATEILGEPWEDEYMDYKYEKGDENFVELLIFNETPEPTTDLQSYEAMLEDLDADEDDSSSIIFEGYFEKTEDGDDDPFEESAEENDDL